MKRILIGSGVLVLLLGAAAAFVFYLLVMRYRLDAVEVTAGPIVAATGTYETWLQHDGRERTYLLHVPPAAASGEPLPLFIALHGGGGHADQFDAVAGLIRIADREGFFVAYPSGIDRNWNDGRIDAGSTAHDENVDDVGFLRAMVADIGDRLPLDERRVYAAGISNGAMMSQRLACEGADFVTAVGLIVGTAPRGFETTCDPGRPVPLIAFLGTADPLVPFEGGKITGPFGLGNRGLVVSAAALEAFWSEYNGCGEPRVESLPDRSRRDDSTVTLHAYADCEAGAAVEVYVIDGGGHTWPGGRQYLSHRLVGRTNRDIVASELIWRFFASKTLP
jgi:polyhydroxybutyrate depolymerase